MIALRQSPWIAQQIWENVLFLHWPISHKELRPYVPPPFELETYNGKAWISVVVFQAKHSRLRGMPTLLSYRSFMQLNIRTYVKCNGYSGVYFFSLDANSPLAVAGARTTFHLPYLHAKMSLEQTDNGMVYKSNREEQDFPTSSFSVICHPLQNNTLFEPTNLSTWLTERYQLWTIKGKKIFKGPLSHTPWKLHAAKVDVQATRLVPFLPDSLFQTQPICHYSSLKHAYLHPFKQEGVFLS